MNQETSSPEQSLRPEIRTALICAAVGGLAAWGLFNNISHFPLIFSGIMILVGLLPVWRAPRDRPAVRTAILLLGGAVAAAGWSYRIQLSRDAQVASQERILAAIEGKVAPSSAGFDPLNTEAALWNEASSYAADATLVTFWARWCSPCWKEMDELEELHREHGSKNLRIVAVTRYDTPEDPDKRQSDLEKAQRFLTSRDITYPAAITDSDAFYAGFNLSTPPGLALIDGAGRIVDFAVGIDRARDLMRQAVELASAGPAAPAP